MAFVVTLLGAESTGKTTLAHRLAELLRDDGRQVAVVDEYLREFCALHGRTPHVHEQRAIAAEQTRRIAEAAQSHELVVADTHALMVAVYSEMIFGDSSLCDDALAALPDEGLLLLTRTDLPWVEDGHQRDGPQVRAAVEALLRQALARAGRPYAVVSGLGEARTASAWTALRHALGTHDRSPDTDADGAGPRWQWNCERCSDGACERHLKLPRG